MNTENQNPKEDQQETPKELGSNLTGTARPATPLEEEMNDSHGKKALHYETVQNTDALIGNIDPEEDKDKKEEQE